MAIQITSLTPPSVNEGDPAFELEINGRGFTRGSKVFMGTRELTGVTFVNNTQLTVPMRANLRAGTMRIKVTNPTGTTESNVVTFTVNATTPVPPTLPTVTAPTITRHPQTQTVNHNAQAQFIVQATGTGLHYEWRKGGHPIVGAPDAATFTIPHADNSHAGDYTVKVSNTAGSVESNPATLRVNRKPMSKGARNLLIAFGILFVLACAWISIAALRKNAPEPGPETAACTFNKGDFGFMELVTVEPGGVQNNVAREDGSLVKVTCPTGGMDKFSDDKNIVFTGCQDGWSQVDGEKKCTEDGAAPEGNENDNANDNGDGNGASSGPLDGSSNDNSADTGDAPVGDGYDLAVEAWGESLPRVPELYSAHQGEEGYPDNCAGLCWDTSKVESRGVMRWYGPNNGEEDITESPAKFGNGTMGPLDLMRTGKVTKVIFYTRTEAQLEVCALGSLDGTPLTEILGVDEGDCGKRVSLAAGWHLIEGNANSPIAGFGVRYGASGWAGMTESQIVQYTKYWKIEGDTATWIGPDDVEIMMTPAMVSMMQDFDTLHNIVFTTKKAGRILLCNGYVTGDANLESPDGSCQYFDVGPGTYTYHGEARLSAGVSWQPK